MELYTTLDTTDEVVIHRDLEAVAIFLRQWDRQLYLNVEMTLPVTANNLEASIENLEMMFETGRQKLWIYEYGKADAAFVIQLHDI